MTALRIDASWLTQRIPCEMAELRNKIEGMTGLIDDTIAAVRRVATELRPGMLDDLGLASAVEWQTEEFSERTGIECELRSVEELPLDRDLATAVFRMLQEALTNVARHAEATEVLVSLDLGPEELVMVVRDNGSGISREEVASSRSLGLIGMRERAQFWGGSVAVEGVPGEGTTVTLRVPVRTGRVDAS